MKVMRHLIPSSPAVLALGHFDGLHLGHRALFDELDRIKADRGLPSRVLTFQQDPLALWQKAPVQLMTVAQKLTTLRDWGVDEVFCVPFNARFAELSAADFLEKVQHVLQARAVVVGEDFHFGAERSGNVHTLAEAARVRGFTLHVVPDICDSLEHKRISSTRLRAALQHFEPALVKALLGHNHVITGRVSLGDQRGRQMGVPTLNLPFHGEPPLRGVFGVRVWGLAPNPFYGVANVGIRPTVGGLRPLLEVHVFDFKQEVYGARVQVEFLVKLRDEKRFESIGALMTQIHEDIRSARQILARTEGW